MIKKRSIFTFGLCFALFASLLFGSIILAQDGGSYDPWMDLNDDGIINPQDLQLLASIYSTSGTPINKTAKLLELEARINSLNTTLLTEYYNVTECDVIFVDASGDTITGNLDVAWDIQCETLEVDGDRVYLGSTEGNQIIFFYDNAIPTGEYIYWQDSADRFVVSDDVFISDSLDVYGSLNVSGTINIPTTTRYYSIPGSAWQPRSSTYDYFRGLITYTSTAGTTYWYAPVNLPHGAVVTEFSAWVWDNSASADIEVILQRQQYDYAYNLAYVQSTGESPSYRQFSDTSISFSTIDNQNYAYCVWGILRSGNVDHRLSDMRITYTITETLP